MLKTILGLSRNKHLLLNSSAGVLSLNGKGISQWTRRTITTSAAIASLKPPVVVFDIDGTIAFDIECTIASNFRNKFSDEHVLDDVRYHIIPHFKSILNYLLSKNVRIAIFSAGTEKRNLELIQKICTRTFGQDHKTLISDGQLEVFSRHHLTSSKKDLMVVLKPDEQLENCVLIDDITSCCKPGQEANFLYVPEIIGFENYGYYYLGLFKSYFESESCNVKPISQFMSEHIRMVSIGYCDYQSTEPSIQFILDMVKIGLDEVRKTEPTAEIYGYDHFIKSVINSANFGYRTTDPDTNLPIVETEPFYRMKSKDEIQDALRRFYVEHLK